ncbi:MAG TPA: hypothetical protein VFM18_04395 [Methanosarcina sp.]|nr:hypothetical protein [Methanosarcina sp.]
MSDFMEGLSIGIERCELKRIKESTTERDARNYRWLRDDQRKYKYSVGNKLFVFDPTSRLYAIKNLCGYMLDDAIQTEILEDMINYLGYEQEIEGDNRFSDPQWRFSDFRYDELEEQAKKELGIS